MKKLIVSAIIAAFSFNAHAARPKNLTSDSHVYRGAEMTPILENFFNSLALTGFSDCRAYITSNLDSHVARFYDPNGNSVYFFSEVGALSTNSVLTTNSSSQQHLVAEMPTSSVDARSGETRSSRLRLVVDTDDQNRKIKTVYLRVEKLMKVKTGPLTNPAWQEQWFTEHEQTCHAI